MGEIPQNSPLVFPQSVGAGNRRVLMRLRDSAVDGVLSGSEHGRRVLADTLRHPRDGRSLGLSFEGVRAITVPFAQSFLQPLLDARAELGEDGPGIVASGYDEDVAATIDLVLRGTARVLLWSDGSTWQLTGAEAQLRATIETAVAIEPFSAAEMAHALEVKRNVVNRRIQRLMWSGALERRQPPGWARGAFQYRLPSLVGSDWRDGQIADAA